MWAAISCEDSSFGDVDSDGIVEVYLVFVIYGCVVCIGKLTAAE